MPNYTSVTALTLIVGISTNPLYAANGENPPMDSTRNPHQIVEQLCGQNKISIFATALGVKIKNKQERDRCIREVSSKVKYEMSDSFYTQKRPDSTYRELSKKTTTVSNPFNNEELSVRGSVEFDVKRGSATTKDRTYTLDGFITVKP